jgi:GNAT superfamily N-acetyltransferase
VKIGRFAVSKDFQNQYIGSLMINWIMGFCRHLSNDLGIRFISVDAYNNEKTIRFYENNFFVRLESVVKNNRKNIPMYRDLCEKFI